MGGAAGSARSVPRSWLRAVCSVVVVLVFMLGKA
jgi:hypothetical protein